MRKSVNLTSGLIPAIIFIAVIFTITFILSSCEDDSFQPENSPPKIIFLNASTTSINSGETVMLECVAIDNEGNSLFYNWQSDDGHFSSTSSYATKWFAPEIDNKQMITLRVTVSDGDLSSSSFVVVYVSPNEYSEPISGNSNGLKIYVSKDAYVSSAIPESNLDYANDIKEGKLLRLAPEGSYNGEHRIYLYFDLDKIPKNVKIDEATAILFNGGKQNNSDSKTVCGIRLLSGSFVGIPWSESKLNWESEINTAVSNTNDSGLLFTLENNAQNIEVNIQTYVQAYVDNKNYAVSGYSGFVIQSFGSNATDSYHEYKLFLSSEYNDFVIPYLQVKYHH